MAMKYTVKHSHKITDVHQHLITLYTLAIDLKAKTVLELGVRLGETTVALLEAVNDTQGRLISMDTLDYQATRDMISGYGIGERWTYIVGDDLEFAKTWSEGPADMIFVDTSHEYEQTKKEIAAFMPHLRSGGLMAFHDTESFPDGVLKPIQEFLKDHPDYRFENKKNNNGLGLLWKP
jgi:predicted O-methyltransferase YrrM